MDAIVPLIFFFGLLFGSYHFGSMIEGINWRTDCSKATVHVSDGKVFDCKERKNE
jgi:hypothetical protein